MRDTTDTMTASTMRPPLTVVTPERRLARRSLAGGALIALLTASHTATDALTGALSALLPTLQQRFTLSETSLALLVATLSFSSSITQPLAGALADRIGARAVAAGGALLTAVLLAQMAVVPSAPLLFAVLAVGGLGSAAFHPAGACVARGALPDRSALAVSIYTAGGTLGLALGPLAVLLVVAHLGVGFTPWLLAPGSLLAIALWRLLPPPQHPRSPAPRLLDQRLLGGPVGRLTVAGVLAAMASVTFNAAVPLWLVAERDVATDAALIGWTLAVYSLAAAGGAVAAGAASARIRPAVLVPATMVAALVPLAALFTTDPGSPAYFVVVAAAGALVQAGAPVMVVAAQDLAPDAVAAASGMLMGFTTGMAGVLYIGIGRLQELAGLAPAMAVGFAALVPGAALALSTLARRPASPDLAERAVAAVPACGCGPCRCAGCATPAAA